MARMKLPLLKAKQSPDPSYSETSLQTLTVLQRRFQHVSLYWCQEHQEMKEEGGRGREQWWNYWKAKGEVGFCCNCPQISPLCSPLCQINSLQLSSYTTLIYKWLRSCFVFRAAFSARSVFVWQIDCFIRLVITALIFISTGFTCIHAAKKKNSE